MFVNQLCLICRYLIIKCACDVFWMQKKRNGVSPTKEEVQIEARIQRSSSTNDGSKEVYTSAV
jgi:hypothetical protein